MATKASRIEYDRLIAEWLSSGRSTTYGMPEHVITITELVVAYLEYAKTYYGDGKRGECANMRLALRPVRRLYGPQPAREFRPAPTQGRSSPLSKGHQLRRIVGSRRYPPLPSCQRRRLLRFSPAAARRDDILKIFLLPGAMRRRIRAFKALPRTYLGWQRSRLPAKEEAHATRAKSRSGGTGWRHVAASPLGGNCSALSWTDE